MPNNLYNLHKGENTTMEEITTKTKTMSMMKVQQTYVSSIAKGMEEIIGNSTQYQKLCGYNILNAINTLLAKEGLTHQSKEVDKESINDAIKFAVVYQLNADNKEVFVIIRNEQRKTANGGTYKVKKVECKPQYKGQLKIISTFGRNVKKVYPEWIVREGDEFTYQTFKGVEIVPPTWTPKNSNGKVVRVVVPVMYEDGFVDYRIAERESVATNIKAQIKQAVMFNNDKEKILSLMKDMTLDELLESKELKGLINDTYTGISAEEMIITKLVINATKRVPIDFNSATERELLEKTFDNSNEYVKQHNAKELLDNQETPIEMEEVIDEITIQPTPKQIEAEKVPVPTNEKVFEQMNLGQFNFEDDNKENDDDGTNLDDYF